MNSPRFLTLTLTHRDCTLHSQVARLYDAFRELRRCSAWKQHVKGGVYAFEATLNSSKGTWHPHLHLVIDGEYFPHKLIRDAWHRVTGDSTIVHIEKVHNAHAQAKYLAEYVAAPAEVQHWENDRVCEYAEALHGRRLLHTFGTLHAANPDATEEPDAPRGFTQLASVAEIRELADDGNVHARAALELMTRAGGWITLLATPMLFTQRGGLPPLEEWESREVVRLIEAAIAPAEPDACTSPDPPPDALLYEVSPTR
jgi:hypothetical protein